MRMGGRKHVIVGMNLGTERLGRETRTRLGNGTPRHGFSFKSSMLDDIS